MVKSRHNYDSKFYSGSDCFKSFKAYNLAMF